MIHQKRAGRTEREVRMCFASSRRESEWIDHTGTGLAYYCSLLSNEEVKLEQLDLVGSDTVINLLYLDIPARGVASG